MGELRRLKEYLRWGQVQQKLTEHARASNKTYSFFDAASELWRSGAVQRGEELPTVSFLDWDLEDLDGFYRRIEQIPVSMDIFYPAFQHGTSGAKAAEQLLGLDTVPSKLAQDQALGLHRHDCFELFYNLQGSLQLFQENSCQTLPEGALGIISPHLTHDIVAGPGCHTIYIPLAEQTGGKHPPPAAAPRQYPVRLLPLRPGGGRIRLLGILSGPPEGIFALSCAISSMNFMLGRSTTSRFAPATLRSFLPPFCAGVGDSIPGTAGRLRPAGRPPCWRCSSISRITTEPRP